MTNSNCNRFLVTGAAGFIGSRVCAQLLDAGSQVVGIDNLNDYYDPALKQSRLTELSRRQEFSFQATDVEDHVALQQLFASQSFEAIINLAARAGVRASVEDPLIYFSTNVMGGLNLLEMARKHKVPKYVLASTSSLYAGQPMPFVETMPVNQPISPYAASKKSAEVTAFTYHHLFGIDVSIVRYFTVYGPAGRPDMSPYRFMHWIEANQPIQLFGTGEQRRDFTFVDDIARGTIAALRPVGYEVFNLGNNQPHSILEMIQKLESLVGKPAVIDHLESHATDMDATWANIEKATRQLEWQPTVSLDEGLSRTWQWYQANPRLGSLI